MMTSTHSNLFCLQFTFELDLKVSLWGLLMWYINYHNITMWSPRRQEDRISLASSPSFCLLSILCPCSRQTVQLAHRIVGKETLLEWEDRGCWHLVSGWLGHWFAVLWLPVSAGDNSLNGDMIIRWSQVVRVVSCDKCCCVMTENLNKTLVGGMGKYSWQSCTFRQPLLCLWHFL